MAVAYKGFRLEETERAFPYGITVKGIGIFRGDELLTMADSTPLAKKLIDQRLKMGIWKENKR